MLILTLIFTSVSAQANWFNSNNGEWKMGSNGAYWDDSGWPEWTPMYWMEEFMDEFDSNGWDDNRWGGNNNWNSGNYGAPYKTYPKYNMNPYGYTPPQLYYSYAAPYYGTYPAPLIPTP